MKKLIPIFVFLALTIAATAYADGTITTTTDWVPGQRVKIVKIHWVADTGALAGEVYGSIGEVNGKVFKVRTDPSADALAPDDGYDVYFKDYEDPTLNYLTTTLENRDTANVEMVTPANVPMYGPVGFSVSAAGDINEGDCWLYVEAP